MHLLAAKPGGFIDDEGIVDLNQTPGEIVVLSAQDTSLGLLADVADNLAESFPVLRLGNLANLAKPAAYDLYESSVLQHASVVVVSMLGGRNYWPYGIDQLVTLASQKKIILALVPGDDDPDEELTQLSSCAAELLHDIWQYLRHGGVNNAQNLLHRLGMLANPDLCLHIDPPRPVPPTVIYRAGGERLTLEQWQAERCDDRPTALLLFYRSHLQSGNTVALDQFIAILVERFNVLAVATLSLKNHDCLQTTNYLLQQSEAVVVINTLGFSQRVEGNASLSSSPQLDESTMFSRDVPVIQAILAANDREDWQQNAQGLRARDIAMNVVLPEYDGRIISRAITFKSPVRRSDRTETDIVHYALHPERATFVAELASNWAALSNTPNENKRVAFVLANYPTRDGRIGNGVGLDTPASTMTILQALAAASYSYGELPENGAALIQRLLDSVTNDLERISLKPAAQGITREDYLALFSTLPDVCQQAVVERWGPPEQDPKFRDGKLIVSGIRFGNLFVGIQPARGFNVDVVANYHDPDLVPPHGYLAFYFWLREVFQSNAVIHIGKHGNLEWLPGKSVGLSAACWPDVALGPMPHLYPFIVNDPGEGAQAKRRAQAVIIDHLMPPLARAESYGSTQVLENLVDEYYQAIGLDKRREGLLRKQILQTLSDTHLLEEIGLNGCLPDDDDALLEQVDTYLCDLKEAQIRHGLHRLGQLPEPDKLPETLIALIRLPRGEQEHDKGILHALSEDLELQDQDGSLFDPLDTDMGLPWNGSRPKSLQMIDNTPWRTAGDSREKLEQLALKLVTNMLSEQQLPEELPVTRHLLDHARRYLLPAIKQSANNEIQHIVDALNGGFVPAGPSGAPSRGRLDVLPTGRNFFSLDARSIPTQAAWQLGLQSAEQLILKHLQELGDYPRQLGISVWGTATMRTGGDDIAQAMALMGVRPVWAAGSNRVVDVEVIPGVQLGRPRVDVTLRISGLFRDAFANVAKLFDTAVQVLADYEDPGGINTIRENVAKETNKFMQQGISTVAASDRARLRVFGSKPGSYGAGLQGLIDQRIWQDKSDLAKAYVNWGGYSYSNTAFGKPDFQTFEHRLGKIEAVVQNQDNREHDLLDSDDYYQFQGGMANTVEVLKGEQPAIYHGDHSNPARPLMRTLKEELNRVIRSRVTNPKWISAMQQHGYKGAFEMAASVDYLFAYDATTNLIDDYQYEAVTDAFILDKENREFLQHHNPDALKEMAERLIEAQQRGLWQTPGQYQDTLINTLLEIEDVLEKDLG